MNNSLSDIEQRVKEPGRQHVNDQKDNYLAKHFYFSFLSRAHKRSAAPRPE